MPSLINRILILGALVVLAGLRPAFAQCAESTPSGCHIGSAALEINLGPLPVDNYLDRNNGYGALYSSCPTTSSVRSCIINYLKNSVNGYKIQGVTGVRFQFGLGGGGNSTPFNSDGTVSKKWANNLQMFFSDLARNVGIKNITPTPNLGLFGGDPYTLQTGVSSCVPSETLLFVKWLPYGLMPGTYYPDCQDDNNAYTTGASNPVFWGWQPFFNLMNTVLSRAAAQGLNVEELDVQNEIDLLHFTVQGRLIYDETTSPFTDVLGTIQGMMNTYFGSGASSRATFSTTVALPTSDGSDCTSVYGPSAMIIEQDEITAAYDASIYSAIGKPTGYTQPYGSQLYCGGSASGMFQFPHSHTQPLINDFHPYIHPYTGSLGDATSRNFYDDVWNFLYYRSFTSHKAMMGEVSPTQNDCDTFVTSMAYSNVNGFNGYLDSKSDDKCQGHSSSSHSQSCLYEYAASNTVIRVWENEQALSGCYVMPYTINPPYSP